MTYRLDRTIQDHSWRQATDTKAAADLTPTQTTIKADCVGPDLLTEQTFVSIDRYRELEVALKTMTVSRDATQERVEALQQLLPLFGLGVNAPTEKAREKIEDLYSQHKELGLKANKLSDQMSDLLAERETLFAKIKTLTEERDGNESSYNYAQNLLNQVWDATGWLERADNEPCGIEYIKRLTSKADREELLTVEVAKLQEGIKNYEAQLKGYAANKRLHILDRITKILRDAEITTVYDYAENRTIETDERVRILCERLKQNTVEWRDDAAKMHKLVDEIRQAHLTLNDLNAARRMGTIDLSLSARIRSLFNTKV